MKQFIGRLLPAQTLGALDYWRFPERRASWGGPFNGQTARLALFEAVFAATRPSAILETGTFRGTTTDCFADTGLPVFTVEGHPRQYGFARTRLRSRRNVRALLGDSRAVLKALFAGVLQPLRNDVLFCYLDAHWNEDLPLAEELEIVFTHCPRAVVMIDDFKVPFDAGYRYDDYGPGKALTPEYIAPALRAHGLAALYPSTPAAQETGMKRGTVVLAKAREHGGALRSLALLREP
jgi:hypothetical protein